MIEKLLSAAPDAWVRDACGVDRDGQAIESLVHRDAYDRDSERASILVIGDTTGRTTGDVIVTDALVDVARQMRNDSDSVPAISVVPAPGLTGNATPYPPIEGFFDHDSDPVSPAICGGGSVIWRLTLIVEVHEAAIRLSGGRPIAMTAERFGATGFGVEGDSLVGALGNGAGDAPGPIPGLRITAPNRRAWGRNRATAGDREQSRGLNLQAPVVPS